MTQRDVASADSGEQVTMSRLLAGRYQLQDRIGSGSMGSVWRAWDELLRRNVAVKEIRLAAVTPAELDQLYERTIREARSAAALSHRGVATVYDVVVDEGHPWIVMELIDGRPLDSFVRVNGPLEPRRAAEIGRELLTALAAAHRAGVLHRDVKPANVLLTRDGRAVLTDFGIAAVDGDPGLTAAGMVMGTPAYMAPERISGAAATPAADLWSLGATLYAAVEGTGPYDQHTTATAAMTAIFTEDPPAPRSAGPLAGVITALLSRDPAARPSAETAMTLLEDAASAPVALPAAAVPGGAGRRGRRRAGRRRGRAAVIIGAVVVCLAAAGATAAVLVSRHHPAASHRTGPLAAGHSPQLFGPATAPPVTPTPSATTPTPATPAAKHAAPGHAAAPPPPRAAPRPVPAAGIVSGAWSGYTVTQGETTQVAATFTVPVVSCTSGEDGPGSAMFAVIQSSDSSGNPTLVEGGFNDACDKGQPSYSAWIVPSAYDGSLSALSEPVHPGDKVTAEVENQGNAGTYVMTVSDRTQGWTQSRTMTGGTATSNIGAVGAESFFGGISSAPVTVTGATVNGAPLGQFNPEADEQSPSSYQGTVGVEPTALDASGENFTLFWT